MTEPKVSMQDPPAQLQCDYFDAWKCRSCTLIETPYAAQLEAKESGCRSLLSSVPSSAWLPAFSGGDRGFRNRVKLVVGRRTHGAPGAPADEADGAVTLGILDSDRRGVDLRNCAIQAPGIAAVIPALASFLESTGLPSYDVPERRGELKYLHITESPDLELMLRFVVRSQHGLDVLRSRLGELRAAVPRAAVISVNLLPAHKAVLEGEREVMLLGESLPMRFGSLTLHLQPKSFFQTNTAVAGKLYAQVADWVVEAEPRSVWDLYCGVGGFALHCADRFRRDGLNAVERGVAEPDVLGVEISDAAVKSARRSAGDAGLSARFLASDATRFVLTSDETPDLVIVNPPRRGIGIKLTTWLEQSRVPEVVYSSCNPESLARDLAAMPSYAVRSARVFDMFPQTSHLEVAVRLVRSS